MLSKSSVFITVIALVSILLAACTQVATSPSTPEQHAVDTIVAATLSAASTATQVKLAETPAVATFTPTAEPASPEPPTSTPTSTLPPSPTPTIPASTALKVAYIKDGNLWLWTEPKDTVQLTDTHDAVDLKISGDGELIAFKRQDPVNSNLQELWVVNTTGTPNPRVLVSSMELMALKPSDPNITGIGVLSFTWRPNTHFVAYNTLLLHEGPGFGPNYDLRLVNADTLAKSTLLDTQRGGIFYYSPDGSQVALSNPDSISLINADGSNFRQDVLTFPIVGTYSEYYYCPHPIWARDSGSLRVAIPPEETLATPLPPTGLWSLRVDGSPAVLLGNILAIPFAWPDNAFAPDLERVIYVKPAMVEDPNQRQLHITNPDGSNDAVYDQGESLEFISWSPDSQHFLYQITGGENKGMYLGGLGDSPQRLVNDPFTMTNIQWLEGSHFASLLSDGSQWNLQIRNLTGEVLASIDMLQQAYPSYDVLP